ncbi:MAG: protein kinase family protein [Gammaproteobacteria bacterium]
MEIISKQSFKTIIDNAEVLLAVQGKPRILRTTDNKIIKIFNSKRQWRHSHKFVHNAKRLTRMGFSTIQTHGRFYCPEDNFIYVTYDYVEGTSAHKYFSQHDSSILPPLARFMVRLHKQGVYFRGCHPEHLIYLSDNDFLLIDMHDTRFFWLPLTINMRVKNLMVLFYRRYARDLLSKADMETFLSTYCEAAGFSKSTETYFRAQFEAAADIKEAAPRTRVREAVVA